ncbi:MAG TPA: glycosyltransferase family 39 protein [Caulobacteraceae bacterium]|nr:glycosyltransferase family 39 protein [Caulobacteraceae bacterium]
MEPTAPGADRFRRSTPWVWATVVFVALAVFLGADIPGRPIVLWDESRLAVNALEMSRTGFSLVTTYGFKPDLWNTKPPLLIWLETASIDLLGASEGAFRLPSFLASLATVALVMAFGWRLARSRFVMLAAPVLLVLSPGYFGGHAAHSGDYESLLCFLTTAYVLLLFELVHRKRPKPWVVLAMGLLVAAACLTKGVAGVVPGVGVFAYVLARGRWPRLLATPWYALAGLIVVVLVGGFYLLRERLAPGYLTAVFNNELGGRYLHGMNGHIFGWSYYPGMMLPLYSLGPALALLFIAPFLGRIWPALRWGPCKSAAFLTYANSVSIGLMLVYGLSRTKIYWYIVPVYPFLSMALAIVCDKLLRALPYRPGRPVQLAHLLVGVAAAYVIGAAVLFKFVQLPKIEDNPQGRYGRVFAELDAKGIRHIDTLDGGVANDDSLVDYTPQRRFYTLVWQARGLDIREDDPARPVGLHPGAVLVTCDQSYVADVAALGAPLTRTPGCAAVASGSR